MNEDDVFNNETRLTRLQALVVEILNDLLRAPIGETDAAIDSAIARIGAYCRRDRSYVFVHDGAVSNNTHEWCAEGIEPSIDQLQGLPLELYGPIAEQLDAGRMFHVPDVSAMEEGSPSRQILESQSIRSSLMMPMRWEGATYGMVGFDGVTNTHAFLPGEMYLLQSVADVICSVLVRREKDEAARAAQQDLAHERAFLASVLSTPVMGVIVIDASGTIIFANDAAETVMGVARTDMLQRSHDPVHWAYTHEDGSPFQPGETPFERVLASGQPVHGARFALHCPDGLRYCSVDAAPIGSAQGNDLRVVYSLLDVTEQVVAERERRDALDEAQRANAAKSNFLAKMSHEMRTPLNGVLGVAEVLEKMVTDTDQRRMVKVMHDSGALLLNIINDLLDMSKIEADLMQIESLPFVPGDLATRLEAVHTLKASEKNLSFAVKVEGDGNLARLGDPHRLLQIMHNVVSNAIKFTDRGTVAATLDCRSPKRLFLRVKDTGIGMNAEQLNTIFEEFSQADSTIARRFGGTGLGMPIVRRLAQMMGGSVTIASEPGEGTEVEIDVPAEITDRVSAIEIEPRAPVDGQGLQGLRILAADDNRTNRMILGAMLGQLGVSAQLVSDGQSALDAFDVKSVDVVILDISMPDLDGVKVMQALRRQCAEAGRDRAMPIIAFTANAMTHQVASYLEAGFDACLTKPLHLDRLNDVLKAAVTLKAKKAQVKPLRLAQGG